MFIKTTITLSFRWLLLAFLVVSLNSCFKNLPNKTVVYENGFEDTSNKDFQIYGDMGLIDSLKRTIYHESTVFGRFNSNYVVFKKDTLPEHNAIKIEFDLYIHDKWDGNFLPTGASYPDLWQMTIDNYPVILTSFSNGSYSQSYPDNYQTNMINNKPFSNSWELLPGVCSLSNNPKGTSHYKIDFTTSHFGPLQLALSDVPNPVNSLCLKSWSIDNLRITAITYN
jgi:hypothetical protein